VEVFLSICDDLSSLITPIIVLSGFPWNNRSVVKNTQQTAGMLGEQDLLLASLNNSR
jgi:hypothetical protein